jgi:chaperonin GroEL
MKLTFSVGRYIYFGQQARTNLLKGIQGVAQPTAVTLGPSGRNVLLDSEVGSPKITKDGVTVAKSVYFVNLLHR